MYDVVIIGCGVVGAATAYELARYKLRVAVLEAAADIAAGTPRPTAPSSTRATTPSRAP